jgi:hypothetical protein
LDFPQASEAKPKDKLVINHDSHVIRQKVIHNQTHRFQIGREAAHNRPTNFVQSIPKDDRLLFGSPGPGKEMILQKY